MPDAQNSATPPQKKGGFVKMLLLAVILLSAGGGGTYGAFAMGFLGNAEQGEEDNTPALILKDQTDPYAPAADAQDTANIVYGDGGSKYRTAYYTFNEQFTSNLGNSSALIQVSLAASTQRDGRVLMWLAEHELAVRSRILIELAATDEMQLMDPGGKEVLQERLTHAINEVLEEREGFGGVNNVYFRSFIVQ